MSRLGKPQFFAVLLLLCFVAQGAALLGRVPQMAAAFSGSTAFGENATPSLSPLLRTMIAGPALVLKHVGGASIWDLLIFAPFVTIGALLGAAVWYIARRLFGNKAGYIALVLYCFSPPMVLASIAVRPEVVAAFGLFGLIYTAIAVAHTLYAPREVVLWNWKRIVLLGLAITFAVGAQFDLLLLLLLALGYMLYLVPHRMGPAAVILLAACAVACLLLAPVYWSAHQWPNTALGLTVSQLTDAHVYVMVGRFLLHNSPGFVLLLATAVVTYAVWPHTRFFGTTAALLTSVVLLALVLASPTEGVTFLTVAIPFLFVFTAGVWADLLESRDASVRSLTTGVLFAALVTHAMFSVLGIARLWHR